VVATLCRRDARKYASFDCAGFHLDPRRRLTSSGDDVTGHSATTNADRVLCIRESSDTRSIRTRAQLAAALLASEESHRPAEPLGSVVPMRAPWVEKMSVALPAKAVLREEQLNRAAALRVQAGRVRLPRVGQHRAMAILVRRAEQSARAGHIPAEPQPSESVEHPQPEAWRRAQRAACHQMAALPAGGGTHATGGAPTCAACVGAATSRMVAAWSRWPRGRTSPAASPLP
jgi:hypothetical protein